MIDSVLYVNIEYKDGLYELSNSVDDSMIPNNISVNTPFFNEENSFEEICEIILEEDDDTVLFHCTDSNMSMVKQLSKCLYEDYKKTTILVYDGFEKDYQITDGEGSIYMINSFEKLNQLEEVEFAGIESFEEAQARKNMYESSGNYGLIMKNGLIACMTGIYPDNLPNTLAKHVITDDVKVIERINDYVDVNGAVLLKESGSLSEYDTIQHVHRIHENEVVLDRSDLSIKQTVCSYQQFNEWKDAHKLSKDVVYFLKIENKEDLNCFKEDLLRFAKTGELDAYEKYLVDECRFTGNCSLKRMARYEVANGMVKPCITSDVVLGPVDRDAYTKKIEANKLYDRTMIQRNCSECAVKATCSRCACISKDLSQEEFCEFMHEFTYIREYIQEARIAGWLGRNSKVFAAKETITCNNSQHSLIGKHQNKNSETVKPLFLYENGNVYYYLNVNNASLVSVEKKFVLLLESWACGESEAQMVQNMMTSFQMDEIQAKRLVVQGMEKLTNGGLVS